MAASDLEETKRCIEKLRWLTEHRKVKIGNVFIVGMSTWGAFVGSKAAGKNLQGDVPTGTAARAWLDANNEMLKAAGLTNSEVVRADRLYQKLDLRYSPTWIVRHMGKDYVYEGYHDPSRWFDRDGQFLPEENQ